MKNINTFWLENCLIWRYDNDTLGKQNVQKNTIFLTTAHENIAVGLVQCPAKSIQ